MLGASSEAGARQRQATASLTTAPLGKENALGGYFFCSVGLLPERLAPAGRLRRAAPAIGAPACRVVFTWFGIPTRCPDSHGKNRRVRRLVQETSAAGWSVHFCLCNGEVKQQRGKSRSGNKSWHSANSSAFLHMINSTDLGFYFF